MNKTWKKLSQCSGDDGVICKLRVSHSPVTSILQVDSLGGVLCTVEVRGQLETFSSFLPPCWSRDGVQVLRVGSKCLPFSPINNPTVLARSRKLAQRQG